MKFLSLVWIVLFVLTPAPPALAQQTDTACDAGSVMPGYYLVHVAKVVDEITPQWGVEEGARFLWRRANVTLRSNQRVLFAGNPEGTADLLVDDAIEIATAFGRWKHDFRLANDPDTLVPAPPTEMTDIFYKGYNLVTVEMINRSGDRIASNPLYMLVFNTCEPVATPTRAALWEQYAVGTPEWKRTPTTATPYWATSTPTATATPTGTPAPVNTTVPTATRLTMESQSSTVTPTATAEAANAPKTMQNRQNRVSALPVGLLLLVLMIVWRFGRRQRGRALPSTRSRRRQ